MQLNYTFVNSVQDSRLIEKISLDLISHSVFGVDTETTGLRLHVDKPRLLQIAAIPPNFKKFTDASIYVFDLWGLTESFKKLLADILSMKYVSLTSPNTFIKNGRALKMIFGHNLKFDIGMLWTAGMDITGNGNDNVLFDTQLAEQLLRNAAGDPETVVKGYYSLAQTVGRYDLGYSLDKTEQTSDWSRELLSKEQLYYAALDAVAPYPVVAKQMKALAENKLKEAAYIDFRCLPAITSMEYYGMKLDIEKWTAMIPEYQADTEKYKARVLSSLPEVYVQKTWAGEDKYSFSMGSQAQLLLKLQQLKVPDPDKPEQLIQSTSKDNLLRIDVVKFPWVADIVGWRKADKAISSFLSPMPDRINPVTGRLHTGLRQHGTITGRVSSTSPNLNQIPRDSKFRDCFVSEDGWSLVGADYSGLELRLIAYVYNERVMLDAYRKDIDADLHRLTAAQFNDIPPEEVTKTLRTGGKCSNFLLCYGGGWRLLKLKGKTQYGFDITAEEAQHYYRTYHRMYKDIDLKHSEVYEAFKQAGKKKRWSTDIYPDPRTFSGRRLRLVDPKSPNQVINFPVQGSASDLGKHALGNLYYHLKRDGYYPTGNESVKPLIYVYDEIMLECKEGLEDYVKQLLQDYMEGAGKHYCTKFPSLILAEPGVGKSWAIVH